MRRLDPLSNQTSNYSDTFEKEMGVQFDTHELNSFFDQFDTLDVTECLLDMLYTGG